MDDECRVNPMQFGAEECKRCGGHDLEVDIKAIVKNTKFITIQCSACLREASTEPDSNISKLLQQAIERWNSSWPDISYFLGGDTEGIHYERKMR